MVVCVLLGLGLVLVSLVLLGLVLLVLALAAIGMLSKSWLRFSWPKRREAEPPIALLVVRCAILLHGRMLHGAWQTS